MQSLHHWPEPVVPVQSLVGVPPIPARYVKPATLRPSPSSIHHLPLPIVDLSSPTAAGDVFAACSDWGFFQAVGHGVRSDAMRAVTDVWRAFFALPVPEKAKYANSPATYEGYGSRIGVEKGAILDWGDYFFLHLRPYELRRTENWPELPVSCRDVIDEYGREMDAFCLRLMKLLSIGLGLGQDRLQEAFGGDEVGMCLRVNFYPKCPQPELTFGLSPHSDPGGLTVLLVDNGVEGLQVRRGNGWIVVNPAAGALVVNVGDQIQILSNSAYKSVEHRVTANALTERLSIALFYNPRGDLPIAPMPEIVTTTKPPLYRPMTFNEYRMHIRSRGPQGKAQIESLKSQCSCGH